MTPQEKLEIFSAYLPYQLEVINSRGTKFILDTYSNMAGSGLEKREIQSVINDDMKPVLVPLSEIQQFANEYAMEFGGGITETRRLVWAKSQLENIQYSAYPALSYSDIEFCLERHINIFILPESEYVKKNKYEK